MKLIVSLLVAGASVACALDFRGSVVQAAGETGTYSYLQFADDRDVTTYSPPAAWGYGGASDKLRLFPPLLTQASVYMEVCALPTSLRLEDGNHVFDQLTRDGLPQGADKVEMISSQKGMDMDGRPTLEVTIDYSFYGGRYRASFLYLTRNSDLVRFQVSCRPQDFQALRDTFHASLNTFASKTERTDDTDLKFFTSHARLSAGLNRPAWELSRELLQRIPPPARASKGAERSKRCP